MRKICAILMMLTAAVTAANGQTVEADLLKAQDAYEKSNVEQAKAIFTQILNSRQQVSAEQRVIAYKYLGAYWALQSSPGARDSATNFFIAALDFDPFTTLDQKVFASDEQAAFGRAKGAIFKVGIKPVDWKALDPTSRNADSSRYVFQVVSTHSARMTVEIVSLLDATRKELLASVSSNDGVRDVPWNGLINNQPADTGLYELRVTATDNNKAGNPTPESQKFKIDHFHAPLEDTLPSFKDVNTGGTDTLKSRYSGARPFTDAGKGLFVTSVAGGLPFLALSQKKSMSAWGSHAAIGVGIGIIAGGGAMWYATSHRDDARAAAENARRRNLRATFNTGVANRNKARLDKTILIIRPLTAAGISG